MAVSKTASLNLLCQTYNKQPLYNSTLHFVLMLYLYPFLSVRYLKEVINFHTTHMPRLKLILQVGKRLRAISLLSAYIDNSLLYNAQLPRTRITINSFSLVHTRLAA